MEKINIAELLKDCPKGMELDCTICNDVKFIELDKHPNYPIVVRANNGYDFSLTKYGQVYNIDDAKCVIFPKGETTWKGFQRPFKDGDILADKTADNILCIYKAPMHFNEKYVDYYCGMSSNEEFVIKKFKDTFFGFMNEKRLATEEEKEKLFKAIKDNGYRWNPETKTLEKLIESKFKVGDVIQDIDTYKVKITEVNIEDECYGYESMIAKGIGSISFSEQDNWELVPSKFDINTLKPFDKVLVRQDVYGKWGINFFGFYNYDEGYYYTTGNWIYKQCIPYNDDTKHLLDTTNDCDEFYKTW